MLLFEEQPSKHLYLTALCAFLCDCPNACTTNSVPMRLLEHQILLSMGPHATGLLTLSVLQAIDTGKTKPKGRCLHTDATDSSLTPHN